MFRQFTAFSIFVIVIFGGMFAHSTFGQSVSTQDNRILIYDGGSDPRSFDVMLFKGLEAFAKALSHPDPLREITPSKDREPDKIKSARKQLLAKSSQIKNVGLEIMKSIESTKTSVNCKKFSKDKIILDSAEGVFTKLNTIQSAFLYKFYFCDEDKNPQEQYADPIGGILIVENGTVVANYVYAGFEFSHLKILPDINQNGLSEILLAREYNDIDLAEIIDNKINVFGSFKEVHSYNGGLDGMPYFYNSKKIYVVPGKNPEFFQESYSKRKPGEWKLSEPLSKVSLNPSGDWSSFFRAVK